jgi:hypothetical protein
MVFAVQPRAESVTTVRRLAIGRRGVPVAVVVFQGFAHTLHMHSFPQLRHSDT